MLNTLPSFSAEMPLSLSRFVSSESATAKRAPADETIFSGWRLTKRWRRRLAGYLFCLPDTGWLGLTPLRTHIVVCGLPRSGTTMLQLMLESALPDARRFGCEVSGWRAAMYRLRNHAVMI